MMRTVAESMQSPVVVVEPEATVQEAAAQMLEAHVHAAVVVDGGRLSGFVTAAQVSDALAEGYDTTQTPVTAIAEPDPPVVGADEPLAEVHERMRAAGRAVLPVVAENREPVGVLADLE